MQIYVVKPGDTLYSIGRTLSLAPGFLARYNGLQEPYRLAVGQRACWPCTRKRP